MLQQNRNEASKDRPARLEDQHKVRIIMVQHDIKEAELILRVIKGFNIVNEVFWIRDGEEAVNFLSGRGYFAGKIVNNQPKLFLVDLRLPKINGFDVFKAIRKTNQTKDMPVILFVSSYQEKDMLEAMTPNDCTYIVKPINFSKLKDAIWSTQYFILPTFWEAKERHTLYEMA